MVMEDVDTFFLWFCIRAYSKLHFFVNFMGLENYLLVIKIKRKNRCISLKKLNDNELAAVF